MSEERCPLCGSDLYEGENSRSCVNDNCSWAIPMTDTPAPKCEHFFISEDDVVYRCRKCGMDENQARRPPAPATAETKVEEREELLERVWERFHGIPSPSNDEIADFVESELALDHAATKARLEAAVKALAHYADESYWANPHPDMGLPEETLYDFVDEIEGALTGPFVAREALADLRREETKK